MKIVADKNRRLVLSKVNLGWVKKDTTDNENAMEDRNIIIYVAQNPQDIPALKACPKLQWSLNVRLIGSRSQAFSQNAQLTWDLTIAFRVFSN